MPILPQTQNAIVPETARLRRNRLRRERNLRKKTQKLLSAFVERHVVTHQRGNDAIQRARSILRSRLSTRPFVQQEQFGGGVWTVQHSTPFEDARRYDYVAWVNSFAPQIHRKMRSELSTRGTFKVFSTVDVLYIRAARDQREKRELRMRNNDLKATYGENLPAWAFEVRQATLTTGERRTAPIISNTANISSYIAGIEEGVIRKLARGEGSPDTEWSFFKGLGLTLKLTTYAPFGAKHCKLPSWLSKKACMVNIQNKDDRCLEYALICALHFKELEGDSNKERVSRWSRWLGTLKFDGVDFPVMAKDMHQIESLNDLAINVYALRDEECSKDMFMSNLYLLHKTARAGEAINLFLYRDHYCYVHDWKAMTNKDGGHKFHCPTCLVSFRTKEALDLHCTECEKGNGEVLTKMPRLGSNFIRFEKHMHTNRHPIAIYSDFESLNTKLEEGPRKGIVAQQTAVSAGFQIECDTPLSIPLHCQVCEETQEDNVYDMFVAKLREFERVIRSEVFDDEKTMLPLTPDETARHEHSAKCAHCQWKYGSKRWGKKEEEYHIVTKIHDHDHRTGQYRIDLCSQCNMTLGRAEKRKARFTPVYFHGGTNYDFHLVLQALARNDVEHENMTCIPKNSEKFTMFTWKPLPCPKDEYLAMRDRHAEMRSWCQSKRYSKEEKEEWREQMKALDDRMNASIEFRFIDTSSFMSFTSLDKLVKLLPDEKKIRLRELATVDGVFDPQSFKYLKRKGIFPYEWFDNVEKLRTTSLPSIEHWDSKLTRSYLKDESALDDARETWDYFGMRTFKDWHDHYLRIDVKGLSDVFEEFRRMCMDVYRVDPAYYYTAPGMFNDALYKKTGARVELLTDPLMFDFFERKEALRGGLSVQVNRFSRANHKHLKSHDPKELTKFILYADANNQYGWAMKQRLPYRHFEWEQGADEKQNEYWIRCVRDMDKADGTKFKAAWLKRQNALFREKHATTAFPEDWGSKSVMTPTGEYDAEGNEILEEMLGTRSKVAGMTFDEVERTTQYIGWARCQTNRMRGQPLDNFVQYVDGVALGEGEDIGLTLEVDLSYPRHLHDAHSDYPLAPESMEISDEEMALSKWSVNRMGVDGKKRMAGRKLCATLHDKRSYVVHWKALQFYMEQGLVVTKVHRVVSYIEKDWMREYIEMNEGERKKPGASNFEKDFFKLANNSVFGKQMENVRKRFKPIKWCTPENYLNESRKTSYVGDCYRLSDNLIAVFHAKTEVTLNKPVQVGQAILDISKWLMFKFHYDVMVPKYGSKKLKLLMTDTDSLVYEISSDDPQYDMYKDLESIKSEFDFSDYPKSHPLYSTSNKKTAGKFKDDKATIIREFCGIRAKMYSLLMADSSDIVDDSECKILVEEYEEDKVKQKGFKRDSEGRLVKTKEYLQHDPEGAAFTKVQKDVQAYEASTVSGVKMTVAEGELRHQDFKNCLLHNVEAPRVFIPTLRSINHQVYMFDSNKKTLNALDDKRHTLDDGCNSLAHGHYQIGNGYVQLYEDKTPQIAAVESPVEPIMIEGQYGSWNRCHTGSSSDVVSEEHAAMAIEIMNLRRERIAHEDEELARKTTSRFDASGNLKSFSFVIPPLPKRPRL